MEKVFSRPVDGALYMAQLGFKVFPLRSNGDDKNQKRPAFEGWQEWATTSEEKILGRARANPAAGWGVFCSGSGLLVLDVDLKKEGAAEAFKTLGIVPATLTVSTWSGGKHFYYRGEGSNTAERMGTGIDSRGDGGYVVAPGTRITDPDTGERLGDYSIELDAPIPPAPDWLVAGSAAKAPLRDAPEMSTHELNKEHHFEEIIDYLKSRAPEAIEGQGGDHTTFGVACMVRDLGVTEEIAFSLMLEHYNSRCSPPWESEELQAKVNNAYRFAQETTPGTKTPEASRKELLEDFEDFVGPKHISEYRGDPPTRSWLINDWLPKGEVTSLYGKGGSGKSLLSLQLALAVASGGAWLGNEVDGATQTLCVFCEDTDDELHRRKKSILSAAEYEFKENLQDIPLFMWARVGQENDIARMQEKGNDVEAGKFMPKLRRALSEMEEGHKLLILDTLSDVYLGNENVREFVNKFVKTFLGGLLNEFNLTILILAHPSRTGSNTGDMLSGSTAWENAVRNRLALSNHADLEDVMVLRRMKSNYARAGDEILLQWVEGRFIVASEAALATGSLSPEQRDMVQAITDVIKPGDTMALKPLAAEIGTAPQYAHLFRGLSPRTIERRIESTLQYPRSYAGSEVSYSESEAASGRKTRMIYVSDVEEFLS